MAEDEKILALREALSEELRRQQEQGSHSPYFDDEYVEEDGTVVIDGTVNLTDLAKAVYTHLHGPLIYSPDTGWPKRPDVPYPVLWSSQDTPGAPQPPEARVGDDWEYEDLLGRTTAGCTRGGTGGEEDHG